MLRQLLTLQTCERLTEHRRKLLVAGLQRCPKFLPRGDDNYSTRIRCIKAEGLTVAVANLAVFFSAAAPLFAATLWGRIDSIFLATQTTRGVPA